MPTKKVVKKEKVIKPHKNEVKLPLPKKEVKPKAKKEKKEVINVEAKLRFVSFTFGATIPTQSFGNVSPSITVEAPTYEEARDFAVSKIEELYARFAENKPVFLGKITETEKVIKAPVETPAPAVEKAVEAPVEPEVAQDATGAVESAEPTVERSEPFKKAEKQISLAMTQEAIDFISQKIKESVKIAEDEKPVLYTMILKKQKEFEGK